jgi:hypothetical protein
LTTVAKVGWKASVDSLSSSLYFSPYSDVARKFASDHAFQIVSILLDQEVPRISTFEATCVEKSLAVAVRIVASDNRRFLSSGTALTGKGEMCPILAMICNEKRFFYSRKSSTYNTTYGNHTPALGGTAYRLNLINLFHSLGGFDDVLSLFKSTPNLLSGTPSQVGNIDTIIFILSALRDAHHSELKGSKSAHSMLQSILASSFENSILSLNANDDTAISLPPQPVDFVTPTPISELVSQFLDLLQSLPTPIPRHRFSKISSSLSSFLC